MHCYYCNKDVPNTGKHCTYCGQPLEVKCIKCGKMRPNGIDFCPHCGSKTKEREEAERKKTKEDEIFQHNLFLAIGALVLTGVLWAILLYAQPIFGISSSLVHSIPIVLGLALYRSYSR